MLFRVLGPAGFSDGTRPVRIEAGKPRLIALLLMTSGNRVVTTEALVDEVWRGRPPASAPANVRTYLSRLRRLLPGRVTATPAGYRFEVAPGELDLTEFTALVAAARARSTREPEAARADLRAALALWRGEPFAGEAAGPVLEARAAAARDDYLSAVELYSELLMRGGEPGAAQALLRDCIREHPLRERLRSLYVLATYRNGDPAGALGAYRETRTVLAAELGIDPGPELVAVHRAVLRRDPGLRTAERLAAPFQLPPVVADFTAREPELAHLIRLLRQEPDVPGTGVTVMIGGMAGVGKSALAVRAAHAVAGAFPDGCLVADLDPPGAGRVLGHLLRSLGVPAEMLPHDVPERAAHLRSVLAGRRVLILAENATDAGTVRHLLPGPGSALLVTGRTALAVPGAHRVPLLPLDVEAGTALLARIAGPGVVAADPAAAAAIAGLCGGLPLGIRAIGTRVAATPDVSLRRIAARLADRDQRLDRMTYGDADVRASLALSLDRLAPAPLTLLRAVSALPVRTFASWLPAALLGVAEADAYTLAERLCDAQLLTRVSDERYAVHDLVRLSAVERPGPPVAELVTAAGTAYLRAALSANLRLPGRPLALPAPTTALAEAAAAPAEWFESELETIGALVPRLAEAGEAELAARLATATVNFCVVRGRIGDWAATHDAIPADAALTPATRALLWLSLGSLHRFRDDNPGALPYLRRAYRLYTALGDAAGTAGAALGWCVAAQQLGRTRVALAAYDRAARLLPALGGTPAAGYVHLAFRQPVNPSPEGETAALHRALTVFEAGRDAWGSAEAHTFLADGYLRRGLTAVAARHARAAVAGYTALRDEMQLTVAETVLTGIHLELGLHDHARTLAGRCLDRATRIGHRWGIASAQRSAGHLELLSGRPAAAIPLLTAAHAGFTEMGLTRSATITAGLLERAGVTP
ncbi:AfsR/SARP family transcriptional regulator [Catenuloplanes indicus]|uniref:DNA-binding SARP family transcriptional activator n=1 Tax=Catenuloplanes indicus TaxID=137267 RepID=A0AAE4AVV9_9ACTN|nr:AfsR/SARP family transcriptional regulator [Catenuloplanes indicus]MDQ0364442.1 DNA-binding SARP family transcriptional activator [Catenuloplanes indicus]